MKIDLLPFDRTHEFRKSRVGIEIQRERNLLHLEYKYEASGIKIPAPTTGAFREGLWENTCFEFFFRKKTEMAYYEWNFSPSGEWACFYFSKYRVLESKKTELKPSDSHFEKSGASGTLKISIPIPAEEIEFSPTAILEFSDRKTYWAQKHLKNIPDFHDPQTFSSTI